MRRDGNSVAVSFFIWVSVAAYGTRFPMTDRGLYGAAPQNKNGRGWAARGCLDDQGGSLGKASQEILDGRLGIR
jgi:hypothetical protein